ncbi:MAG: helix-turn-helix domain-containing protein, partial [Armatimonadota bacterium]
MNDQSIGDVLRAKREDRGLSFDEVHEATKITPENLAALEENRFDVFANKVYARAFLRDYANFLGLDSALLLARYEEEWAAPAAAQAVVRTERSAWRAVAWAVAEIVLVGAVGAGSYYFRWAGARESEPGLRMP